MRDDNAPIILNASLFWLCDPTGNLHKELDKTPKAMSN